MILSQSISRSYIITLTPTVRLCGAVKKVVIDFHILVDVRLLDNFLEIEWVVGPCLLNLVTERKTKHTQCNHIVV